MSQKTQPDSMPAAWLGQRGIYRSRLEAVCNGEQLVDPLTLGELIQHAWRYLYLTRRAGRAYDQHGDIRQDLTQQAEAERPELWAVHTRGPDELYAAFSREDADKHAADLNALPMPEGITVDAVVVPSPWPEAEHWKYLAEQERDYKNEIAGRLRQFERICEGLPQDAIDGGWTVQGIRAHSKQLEEQLKVAQAEVEALRAENSKLSEALDRWPLIRERLNLRLDYALAKISKLESRRPGKEVPQAWLDVQAERKRQVEACALALAEIERLDRAAASQGGPSDA
ncbi:hypothetical protein [Pseudomonas aeruginosa]|uniref:hypothetical protein n=1 Tax=Pseudomonas aeruginosa TaxID=287 RepID=UPI00301BBC34